MVTVPCLVVDGEFEDFEITSYSTPPELPDVMKTLDGSSATAGKE